MQGLLVLNLKWRHDHFGLLKCERFKVQILILPSQVHQLLLDIALIILNGFGSLLRFPQLLGLLLQLQVESQDNLLQVVNLILSSHHFLPLLVVLGRLLTLQKALLLLKSLVQLVNFSQSDHATSTCMSTAAVVLFAALDLATATLLSGVEVLLLYLLLYLLLELVFGLPGKLLVLKGLLRRLNH